MTETRDDDQLKDLFQAARACPQDPGAPLLARVLQDAEAELAARQTSAGSRTVSVRQTTQRDWGTGWVRALGGWPAAAGLSLATCAGVWIGVAAPEALTRTAQSVMSGGSEPDVFIFADGFGLNEEAM
ncbi:MAG: hypothetical protein AAGA28_01145 [Pseudomonadota bacterium]